MISNSWTTTFTESLLDQLETTIASSPRPIAAFDADGTLWEGDLGEALFDYQVRNRLVPMPNDPWQEYERLKAEVSHEVAYLWLAQINQGIPLAQVRSWAKAAVEEMHPVPIFPEVRRLIAWLRAKNVEVYIVTASVKWAVEPGAELLGLSHDRVLGITTAVKNGLVTSEQEGPITYRRGKVDSLLAATGGVAPLFCAGNTEGDLPLLESATGTRLVLASAPHGHKNHATEWKMQTLARERGWFHHSYLG